MPIYEFHCPRCRTLFQFFSRRVEPEKIPVCPRDATHGPLVRTFSRFSLGRSASTSRNTVPERTDSIRDSRLGVLLDRAERIDEHDGRALGDLMRRVVETSGDGGADPVLQEAIVRLEAGEPPERVIDQLDGQDRSGRERPSLLDDHLYDL